mgnify:CR=1 FL=1
MKRSASFAWSNRDEQRFPECRFSRFSHASMPHIRNSIADNPGPATYFGGKPESIMKSSPSWGCLASRTATVTRYLYLSLSQHSFSFSMSIPFQLSFYFQTGPQHSWRVTKETQRMYAKIAQVYRFIRKIVHGPLRLTLTRKKRKRFLKHSKVAKEKTLRNGHLARKHARRRASHRRCYRLTVRRRMWDQVSISHRRVWSRRRSTGRQQLRGLT